MKMRFTSEVISLIIFAGINLTGWCESNPIINIPTESKTIGFTKKIVWVWGLPRKTIQDAYAEVDLVKRTGFNTIVTDWRGPQSQAYLKAAIEYAHNQNIGVWTLVSPIYGEWGWQKAPGVSIPEGCLQEYPSETLATLDNPQDPDRVQYSGPWMCIDRPEVRRYAIDLSVSRLASNAFDGIALDFVGYKNYRGCQCTYSSNLRAAYAKTHRELSGGEIERRFSLSMLQLFYQEVRDAVKKQFPKAEIACHAYPQFDPEPINGPLLPVDYPGDTVAWFFKPHWSLEKIAAQCREIKNKEHQAHNYVTGTALMGIGTDAQNGKTPEQIRQEIKTIKQTGIQAIMIVGSDSLLKDPMIIKVLAEELSNANSTAIR